MKEILYIALLINLTASYKIAMPENNREQCLRITLLNSEHQTILLDIDNNTDTMLKTCLLKNIYKDQSLLLLKGVLNRSPKKKLIMSFKPNVVVITKTLNQEFLNSISLKEVVKSHSNLLYIISTDKSSIICDNGRFNQSVFRYVQNFLNRLWKQHRMSRVVLTFPYTCSDNTYVIYDGKKQSNTELYDRTIKLIEPKTFDQLSTAIENSGKGLTQGYPLKTNIFDRFPTSIRFCNKINEYLEWNSNITNGFCGFDGLILQETVNHFHFQVSFPKDENCSTFGYLNLDTGIVSGSLGCVLKQKIDISFNSRFMVLYANDIFYYLHYITQDSLCVLLPRPDLIPLWYYPFYLYDMWSIIFLITTIMTLGIVSWFSYTIRKKIAEKKLLKIHDHFFDYITCVLFGFSIKKHSKYYILRGVCLISSIIISARYQGYINYTFTNLIRDKELHTLKQLYSSNRILHTSTSIYELLKPLEVSDDEVQALFFKNTRLHNHSDINFILENRNVATIGRRLDAKLEILLYYKDENRKPLLYVLDECFTTYYLSYIARNRFPFVKELKIFMERLLQAGLPKIYYKWTQRSLNLPDTLPKYNSEARPEKALSIKDQCVAIFILLVGYVISILVFLGEKWLGCKKHKNASQAIEKSSY